jgi:L-2,4-diaminobutyrate decarboxylase
MNSIIAEAMSPVNFRNQAHEMVDMLADYLENSQKENYKTVIPYIKPEESLATWQADFDAGISSDPKALFSKIIEASTHLHHPKYMGHQVVPPMPLAATAGFLSEFLNNGMAVYEMGLVSNPMERIVTDWMNKKIGYDAKSNGLMTSGGTLGNLTALLTARAMKAPNEVWTEGHAENLAIMVSEEAHYCVDRAARVMGLGTKGIIKIPTDAAFKMKTELLEETYNQAIADGLFVFAIIGSASSTSTGSHDDLNAIADFSEKHNIWFHVDAAHGGGAVFSKKYNYLLEGLHRGDSIVIDFHKMMMTPALATAVLYRNGDDSYETFQQKAQYLWSNQTSQDWFNSGKRTFECTKLGMSLKVYALLKTYGEELFEANVDVLYDLGRSFAEIIKKRSNFELALEPETNIVNFRFSATHQNLNEFNAKIRTALIEKGDFYIVQTTLREKLYLRVSLMNPLTTVHDLNQLLDAIEDIATITK